MLQNHQLVTPEQSSWSCSYFSMFGVRKWTMKLIYFFKFCTNMTVSLKKKSLMAACNWVVCKVECRCVAITGANIPVPCHMCLSLWLGWGLGNRWCVQRVPGHRLGCGDQEMGCEVVVLVVPGGRHAPLDWNSYCVHELAHNTLLFLFVFFTNNCCFSIKVCHVLLCMSRNTGQINPAGFQSLKYMYYTHVIMTINWFLTLTLTLLSPAWEIVKLLDC